eukprot:CAMPEP_0195086184 /NCGR_PEP_ID=MMETSP0448-20130528/26389_1 /TAXON_ID=66468 /ORGANISM="Heterocapsa triquestra, Strain CCMP 448" /LENGTH=163 /DNA_ID=CAMNT_0040119629 /DNA_START=33 /DNA_END=521 /DNA_ORIENTATION=-
MAPPSSVTPGRKSLTLEPVSVLGAGAGGLEELREHVDDKMVSFALLRFQVGGGTFVRTKLVAIHCNGGAAPVMLRGWLNARRDEVFSVSGEVHANIEVQHAEELTIEYLCERLLPLFAADSGDYSLQALRHEYAKSVAQEASRRRLQDPVCRQLLQAEEEEEE